MDLCKRLDFSDKNILILSCGGGYDIYCGIPVYLECIDPNNNSKPRSVHLASFSFTYNKYLSKFESFTKDSYIIKPNNSEIIMDDKLYFPEYRLCREIKDNIYATNTETDLQTYETFIRKIIDEKSIDVIFVIDGGCDSILSGLEEDLATPVEDMMTIYLVRKLANEKKIKSYLGCLGVTVELIAEGDFEKNVQRIKNNGGLLNSFSLQDICQNKKQGWESIQRYIDIFMNCQTRSSIINSSIVSSLQGHEGKYINPLLLGRISLTSKNYPYLSEETSKLWVFDLETVANNVIYLNHFDNLETNDDIDVFVMSLNYALWRSSYDLKDFYEKSQIDKVEPYVKDVLQIIKNV